MTADSRPTRLPVRQSLLLAALAGIVLFPWLGATQLWDEDEGYFASAAAEMFRRGDWIVPYFNGELFGHKPPWMYWMMMLGFTGLGVNEAAARLFSAVFGLGAVLLTQRLGQRLFNARVGFLAGFLLATSVMFNVVARAATPDIFLVFFTAAALLIFVSQGFASATQASAPRLMPQRWRDWAAIYVLLGLAMLVKGPIGFLFPMAVIGLFLLCMTPRRALSAEAPAWRGWLEAARPFGPVNFALTVWRMRPVTAAALILLVSGPWFLAVGWRTQGEFLREFFGVHHFQRFSSPMDSHSGSLLYYPASILAGMFPWTVLTTPLGIILYGQFRDPSRRAPLTILLCWICVYLGIFSLAATKLPNYVLPAYPALALLGAAALDQWMTDARTAPLRWLQAGLWFLPGIGLLIAIGCPLAASWAPGGQTLLDRVHLSTAIQRALPALGWMGAPLAIGGLAALALSRLPDGRAAVGAMSATAIALWLLVWGFAAPHVDPLQTPQAIAKDIHDLSRMAPDRKIAQFGFFRPSMVFYAGHAIEGCPDAATALRFLDEQTDGLLVINNVQFEKLQSQLPADVRVLARRPQFPKQGEILLLGRPPSLAGAARAGALR